MILPIVTAPHAALRTPAAPVSVVDDVVRALCENMLQSMYAAKGIGLAAPQVGISRQVIVLDVTWTRGEPTPLCLINPTIVGRSGVIEENEEGCLSVPGEIVEISRHPEIEVHYVDPTGTARALVADGLLARCLQHEIDHLHGKTIIDGLSSLKRSMALRRVRKHVSQR
jgi:peptide deformylase